MPGFVIQAGAFDTGLRQKKADTPIINEAENGLENKKGTLAMHRNQNIHSATSQFFINLNDKNLLKTKCKSKFNNTDRTF